MKRLSFLLIVTCFLLVNVLKAQTPKLKMAVLNIDTKDLPFDPEQMGNLVRLELDKLDQFEVMDRYDVKFLAEKNSVKIQDCYGKLCAVESGSKLGADKVLTGSAEFFGDLIVINLKLVDVKSGVVEKTQVNEFLNLPKEMQAMIGITLKELFGREIDNELKLRLSKKDNYESSVNNPYTDRLRLDGPRMGLTVFTGRTAQYMMDSRANGGFEAFPVMFQFGYQFETQYLNEGNFQALFEFVPLVTGLDQGYFIPSFTVLNGLRNNKNGFEFAFGPTFSIVRRSEGYFEYNKWHQSSDWKSSDPNPNKIFTRIDSKGEPGMNTGFVFAFGKTFKSGKLNIPVNAYVIPHKDGFRFGASFGFNGRN